MRNIYVFVWVLNCIVNKYMIGIWVRIMSASKGPHKDTKLLYMSVS